MKYFILCFIFIVIAMILSMKGTQRTVWMFVGIFILDNIFIGPINVYTLYLFAFIASLLLHGEIKKEWECFPFKSILCVLFLLHIAVALFDGRINNDFIRMTSRIFNYFIPRYMALFVGYALLNNLKEWKNNVIPLFFIFAVMGIYGFITGFLQSNPYYEMMNDAFMDKAGIWTEVQSRGYRVMSTLANPIVYGFIMCMAGHLVFLWKKSSIDTVSWTCLMLLLVLNVFLANSRTGIITGTLLVFIFLLSKYRLSRRMYVSIAFSALALLVMYFAIPQVRHVTDSTIDIFISGGDHTRGSSVALKFSQMEASMYFFKQAPFWGNGFYFFREVIFGKDVSYSGGNLAGMEGFGYELLVEEGLFMIIGVMIFFYSLFAYFSRRRYLGDYAHAGVAWTVSFIVFIMFAGDYGGIFTIGMIMIGFILKFVQLYEILYIDTSLQCSPVYRPMFEKHTGTNDNGL